MKAGYHIGNITPPIPCGMGGYAARTGPAEGVHDPLFVRSMLLEAGGERVGLITCDLLQVDRSLVVQVRERVARLAGMDPDRVMLLASHTHAGPAPQAWHPHTAPPEYLSWLPLQLAGSLVEAADRLEEVEVAGAVEPVRGLGSNRTDPAMPHDPTLRLIALHAGGWLSGVLLNYGCHPTVMGAENRLISADWPGAAVSLLTRALGPDVWVGFAQGAAGDVSARFTRKSQSFAEVERHGRLLAGAALSALGRLEGPRPVGRLGVRSRLVRLEPRRFPPPEEAVRQVAEARARLEELQARKAAPGEVRVALTALQGAEIALRFCEQSLPAVDCEVQAICLGSEVAIVGIAGEPFSALGREIRERSPFATTLVAGYANGYCGYLPDRGAFAHGGYEALAALTEPGSGERLVATAVDLLTELKAEVLSR